MLYIVFLFEFMVNICCKYLFIYLFCKYSRVPVDIKKLCKYPHNRYPHGYEDGYEMDMYQMGRVWGSYYPYLTYPIGIPSWEKLKINGLRIIRIIVVL